MATPKTNLQIRADVRSKNNNTDRMLLMIYHELRLLGLLLYNLDLRRTDVQDRECILKEEHFHVRPDDEIDQHCDWAE